MKQTLLLTCFIFATILHLSCHTEPEEMRSDLIVRNASEQEVHFNYKLSGVTHTFSIGSGEKKTLCSQEFFSLTYLLGDSVDFRFGENEHCYHTKKGAAFSPTVNNILDPDSWAENPCQRKTYTSYTYTINISKNG
jgi:hypothetical protein